MNKNITIGLLLLTVTALVGIPGALAYGNYLTEFGTKYSTAGSRLDTCGVCHYNSGGGGPRNPYGTDFENQSIHSSNPGQALANIESLDSDGDTFTNIDEIKALTFPGNASDHPAQPSPPPSTPATPAIVNSSPTSPVADNVGAIRTFSVEVNQTVDVTWYINGTQVQTNTSITGASYTNNSAALGTWNVSAVAANSNGTVMQKWDWSVKTQTPSTPAAPVIVSSSPTSPVMDNVGAARTFSIAADQNVDITWYINGTQVQSNTSVTGASYTNNSAALGTWNVSAVAANANGTVAQEWNWIVTESSQPPAPGGQTANVTFVVIDNKTGLPVDGAKVSMNGTKIKTDNTGTAVFTGIVPGDYKYKVSAKEYLKTAGNISVTNDITVTVKLVPKIEERHTKDKEHTETESEHAEEEDQD
jgi:hypothetical protein